MKDHFARLDIENLTKDVNRLKEDMWKTNLRIEGLAKALHLKEDQFPHFEKVQTTDNPNDK